ncbi:MAG TPA: response regulator [Anaeromyxobacteraceae bacterium]|nr:response regulator [Anaeromyxobacteraceae bacterium]
MSAPHRILVVDDNDALRENLAECLEGEGYHVAVAGDGRGALASLAQDPLPGVILIDMMMPGMSGPELVSRIRAEPRLAGIPVVLATGMSPARGSIPVDAILQKPFGINELLDTVRPLLERGGGERS